MTCVHGHCDRPHYLDGRCKTHHDIAWALSGMPTPTPSSWRDEPLDKLCADCIEAYAADGSDLCHICGYRQRTRGAR